MSLLVAPSARYQRYDGPGTPDSRWLPYGLPAGQVIVRSTTIGRSDSTIVENSAPPRIVAGSIVIRRIGSTVARTLVVVPSDFWNSYITVAGVESTLTSAIDVLKNPPVAPSAR